MKTQTKILVDKRDNNDIIAEIKRLSEAYTPEWNFDTDNPDIASTIGIIYADQIAENIERVNGIIDSYHTEFVNMLDISIRPATPAQSIVIMELAQDTVDGAEVPYGIRLLGDAGELEMDPVVFETMDTLYVTNAKIKNVFMTDREDGTVVPLVGKLDIPDILSNAIVTTEDEENDDVADVTSLEDDTSVDSEIDSDTDYVASDIESMRSFRLFGENSGIEQNVVMFYHASILGSDGYVFIRIEGNDELRDRIVSGSLPICYVADGKLTPVERIKLMKDGRTIALRMDKKHTPQKLKDGQYGMLALVENGVIDESVYVDSVKFSSAGDYVPFSFVGTDNQEFKKDNFKPFSDILALYNECYLGHDTYFGRPGSRVTIDFDLTFDEKLELLTVQEEEEELKIIKRRPKTNLNMVPSRVYAQEIQMSYFNGKGYKNLEFEQEIRYMFADNKATHVSISFICPSDWEPSTVGAYDGRTIRLQLLKADNCYMRPAAHFSPRIRNLKLNFKYNNFVNPDKVYTIVGTKKRDISSYVMRGEKYPVFTNLGYEDALYIGFDRRPARGPVSILISIDESMRYEPVGCIFEYGSREGFRPLKVIDGTEGMSKSGLIMFIPPTDFYDREIEGNRRFWLRISREKLQKSDEVRMTLPIITSIRLNGIRVQNTDTKKEEDFYLDEITPYARFTIPYSGILSCDVWVNEFGTISETEMRRLEETNPANVRTEYDIQGGRTAFYTRWQEVERLETSENRRVYMLDRLSSELLFGDGIQTEIPRVTNDVTLKVVTRVSSGEKGNLEPGQINGALGNLVFIGEIYNPVKGYGGNNMETVDAAMERGANIISSRRRLVSEADYIKEIKAFSNLIEQVVCINGYDSFGRKNDGMLTILLLLKDFEEGSFSFHQTQMNCKNHILKHCELTLPDTFINISEPVYVRISVVAWIRALKIQDSFEIQANLEKMLNEYLNPISREGYKGWKIGTAPTTSQLMMRINSFKQEAVIDNVAILVNYIDANGEHEMDLNEFEMQSYMVCCPGKHQIHVEI